MNLQIGIAADGRGKMGIILQHQTVMAAMLAAVLGLRHGTQQGIVDNQLDVVEGCKEYIHHEPQSVNAVE